jgi:Txe/YoeB family toxin of Txe-Axe toxin-antitoxin module
MANFDPTDDQRKKNREKLQKGLDKRIKELIEGLPEDRYKNITKPHEELKVTLSKTQLNRTSFYGLTSEELDVLYSHLYSEVFTNINIDQKTQDNLKTKDDKQFGEYFAKLEPQYLVASRICENKPIIVGNRLKCKGKSWRMVQNNDDYISIPNPDTSEFYDEIYDAPVTDYIYNIPNNYSKIYYLPNNNQDTKTKVDPGINYQNLIPIKELIPSLK